MRRSSVALALSGVLLLAQPSIAQQTLTIGATTSPVLRIGTEVIVKTRVELTTQGKALRVGERFEVETSEPVMVDGHVIIPVGTPGTGEVTSVTNKGMWGKSGHFDVRLLYLRLNDRQIRLSGKADDKGKAGGVGAVAVSAIVFLPAGFFMTGTSARLPVGTVIKGFLDEDVPLAFNTGVVAAPLVISSPPVAAGTPKAIEVAKVVSPSK